MEKQQIPHGTTQIFHATGVGENIDEEAILCLLYSKHGRNTDYSSDLSRHGRAALHCLFVSFCFSE